MALYSMKTKKYNKSHSIVSTMSHIHGRVFSAPCDSCTTPGQPTFLWVFVLELAGVEQKESNNDANEMING